MHLQGANSNAAVIATGELPGKSNYFIGNDPKKWRTNVPSYAQVKYRNVYPGVDLVYYGNQQQLEYDFVVAPGADPHAIALYLGAGTASARQGHPRGVPLQLASNGDLVINTEGGEVRFQKPVVYQPTRMIGQRTPDYGRRTPVAGKYVIEADNQVRFLVPSYDPTRPLVIDPVLSYSTYLGGNNQDEDSGIR